MDILPRDNDFRRNWLDYGYSIKNVIFCVNYKSAYNFTVTDKQHMNF